MAQRDGPLAFGRPHPPEDRLQAEAVLVRGPDFDRRVRVLGPLLSDGLLQLFFTASRSPGVAEAGWRGRGFCTDQLIASGPPNRVGAKPQQARVRPPSRPPPS